MATYRKANGGLEASQPIVTDGKIYLLHHNVKKVEDSENYEYDEIVLSKKEYDYYKNLNDDSLICKIIRGENVDE